MKHSFLFEECIWIAKGIMIDEAGIQSNIEGKAIITHEHLTWRNVGWMKVLSNPTIEFQNVYEIKPFDLNKDTTSWISQNPALGRLIGNFVIVDDSILSLYRSETNEFIGTEYLKQIDKYFYINRGALMQGDKKISSWSVELKT